MIDGVCRAAAHLRRACSLARVLMMGSTPDASLAVAVRRRGSSADSVEGRIVHSQSVWPENEGSACTNHNFREPQAPR